jgi:hypothetical protein
VEIQEVDVFIAPDGQVRLEVRGVKGKKCLALTEDIEKLLGGVVASREMTPEYDEEDQATVETSSELKSGW